MRASHLRLCAIGVAVALGYLLLTGASATGVGVLIAALACPLAMVLAMAFLMGHGRQHGDHTSADAEDAPDPMAPR